MVQLMPLPHCHPVLHKIQIGLTFLVPAYPVCPGKEAIKWVYVCLCCCNIQNRHRNLGFLLKPCVTETWILHAIIGSFKMRLNIY